MQAEHERVQSQLFELREQKEMARSAISSAADLASEEQEALGLHVRYASCDKDLLGKGLLKVKRYNEGLLSIQWLLHVSQS